MPRKKLTLADVSFSVDCRPEDAPVCTVVVVGRYKGLSAYDTLGCCSYLGEQDFCQPGGYWDDMRSNVLADLQAQLDDISSALEE